MYLNMPPAALNWVDEMFLYFIMLGMVLLIVHDIMLMAIDDFDRHTSRQRLAPMRSRVEQRYWPKRKLFSTCSTRITQCDKP